MSERRSTAVVAVATPNHLHRARSLFESVARHLPQADRHLALVSRDTRVCGADEPFDAIPVSALGLPDFESFSARYAPRELAFAVKPWAMADMLRRGYERVIYLDSDIVAYASLQPLVDVLDDASIALTPHRIDARMRDIESERLLLLAGAYNAGFVGLRRSDTALRFIGWWQRQLEHHCLDDVTRGFCGDQRFLDLVPSLFDDVTIVREPGWNVGHWNLDERTLERSAGGWRVNDRPLLFVHFSRLEGNPPIAALHGLDLAYAQGLDRHGRRECARLANDFGAPRRHAAPAWLQRMRRMASPRHWPTALAWPRRVRKSLRARA